ncbi:TPA: sugar ABC transporter permease [Candidatus Acetothermia bacterium]|nr:sugar ABC transporter permease [Candidatus Acetothermia bacterium]
MRRSPRTRRGWGLWADKNQGYWFILPCFLLLAGVMGFPTVMAILNSFTPIWTKGFQGFTLDYYARLLRDHIFWNSIIKTLYFVGATVALHLGIGFLVALALNTEIRARRFFRVMAILPWTLPDVIVGLVWAWMYDPLSGIVNDFLHRIGLIASPVEWLANPTLVMPSVIIADAWRGYPFVMLVLLAGLQAIPKQLYEAAKVDGASWFQELWHITLPNLKRMIVIATILDIIWQTRRFGLIWVMTQGGPARSTEILSVLAYKNYFKFFNFEYASAMSVAMAIFLLVVGLPYVRMIVRRA